MAGTSGTQARKGEADPWGVMAGNAQEEAVGVEGELFQAGRPCVPLFLRACRRNSPNQLWTAVPLQACDVS